MRFDGREKDCIGSVEAAGDSVPEVQRSERVRHDAASDSALSAFRCKAKVTVLLLWSLISFMALGIFPQVGRSAPFLIRFPQILYRQNSWPSRQPYHSP